MSQTVQNQVPPVAPGTPVNVPVVLTVSEDTSVIYVSIMDVSHTIHDFSIAAARGPVRITAEQYGEISASGSLPIEALMQLIIPPTVIPNLIRSLIAQKELYETNFGPILDLEKKNVG